MENNIDVEVSSFISSFDDFEAKDSKYRELIAKVEQNFAYFENLGRDQEGSLQKLAFISAILRESNLSSLIVEHSFESTSISCYSENYICSVVAESYTLDAMPFRGHVINRFNELREKYIKNPHKSENFVRNNRLVMQRKNILSFFEKIKSKLLDDDASIGMLSYFLFEMEALSEHRIENLLMFFDLYDLDNVKDKWFSAINIESNFRKIGFKLV